MPSFWSSGPTWFLSKCGFRGKAVTIPKSSRAAFRNDAGHDSGMKPVTDSDFKPVTFRRGRNPDRDHFGEISTGRRTLDNNAGHEVPLDSGGTHIANEKVVH